MGHIRETKLKKGGTRFQAEVRLRGHPTLTATFDRKTDAKAWVQKVETDIRCGRHHLYSEGKKHTFKEAVDRYLSEQKASQAKQGHLLWWVTQLGPLYIQDVRAPVIVEKKRLLLTEPNAKSKLRSPATCNRYLASLSHLLSVCERQWEWIFENPVRKITREKEPHGRTRFLSAEEKERLLKACQESQSPLLRLFVILLLSTGCRYSEIKNLKFSTDIDLVNGRITLQKTKNGKVHSVPIRGLALELLRTRALECDSIGYVFAEKQQRKPMDLRRAFRTAIKKANLVGFKPHDARHTLASDLIAQGMSLGEVGLVLNHTNASTTKRYCHLTESRAVEAIEKITEELSKGA